MSLPQSISTFHPPSGGVSPLWLEPVPVIVAESLERVEDPLLSILTPAQPAQPGEVLAALGAVAARPLDPRPGPLWLRPEQRTTWRQLLPILERFHCALLADPVGSGKTWIALAVAQSWNPGEKTTIIVPAAIAPQWERTAALLEVDAVVWSYERLSRGHLPTSLQHPPSRKRTLVIVDESHHLRIPTTRRYFTLAPAVMGRTLLMLSATPVVNRLTDLAEQLLLGLPDDGLRVFGIRRSPITWRIRDAPGTPWVKWYWSAGAQSRGNRPGPSVKNSSPPTIPKSTP